MPDGPPSIPTRNPQELANDRYAEWLLAREHGSAEPFEALLGVVQLVGSHGLHVAGDRAHVRDQLL